MILCNQIPDFVLPEWWNFAAPLVNSLRANIEPAGHG